MRLVLILILISSFNVGTYKNLHANDIRLLTSEQTFKYAEKLYKKNDHYRSITEFKRYIFFGKNKLKKERAELYIGLNYLNGEDYQNAKYIFNNIQNTPSHSRKNIAALRLADASFYEEISRIEQHKNSYFSPLHFTPNYYNKYLEEYEDNRKYYDEAYTKLIMVNMLNLDRYKSFYLLNNAPAEVVQNKTLFNSLTAQAKKMRQIPQRSKLAATIFSIIIPGLGQIYAGEVKEGFIALVVNAAFGYSAYYTFVNYSELLGIFIAQYELTFYLGNIVNAQNAVKKFNENQKNLFRREILTISF